MATKKILFLTGTRADFGKLKTLMREVNNCPYFELRIFITGMHTLLKYGHTYKEVLKEGYSDCYRFINQNAYDSMDIVLAKTITGLSDYIKEDNPDMIVVHGDRVETLAGAIVGSLNNILVSHIEGGEVSGTIDELIRHSVSKLAHIHWVCNDTARKRLIQLGEDKDAIHTIGSPDLDVMNSPDLPSIESARSRYDIEFDQFCILLFHPVTTEIESLFDTTTAIVDAIKSTGKKTIVIYPNNDLGSDIIFSAYRKKIGDNPSFQFFPSVRFEYFISLLKHCNFIIGNSSAGIREAPFLGTPTIDIGDRQKNRGTAESVIRTHPDRDSIVSAIQRCETMQCEPTKEFGDGLAYKRFIEKLLGENIWQLSPQKYFYDLHVP